MDQFVPQTPQYLSAYVSAPTSPSGCSLDNMQFYSAPSSPIRRIGNGSFRYGSEMEQTDYEVDSDSDEFEFEISRNVVTDSEFEASQRYDYHLENKQELLGNQPEHVESFSKMAFADELFSNGQVLPLKLPPGRVGSRTGPSSIATSPRSLSPMLRIPFSRRYTWNDNFDPFTVALEKVRDEKRGRKSFHRRSRSLSPFRTITTTTTSINNTTAITDTAAGLKPTTHQTEPSPKNIHMVGPKGLVYARWVHRESMGHKRSPSPEGLTTKPKKGLSFGRKVKQEKVSQERPTKPTLSTLPGPTVYGEQSEGTTSKVKKMKGILMKYASFGKEKNEGRLKNQIAALWKPSYLNRLSFKFKGNGNGKKKVCGEPKMAVVQYKPKPNLGLCLGHGIESPII